MHGLTSSHGWYPLLMILAIFGWSALMLLLVYPLTKLWRPPGRDGRLGEGGIRMFETTGWATDDWEAADR